MPANLFLTDEYFEKIPLWHTDDSSWKSKDVLRMMHRNSLSPRVVGEVGCGTGEVLRQLQAQMHPECIFRGYDIAPKAIELSRARQNERLQCRLADIARDPDAAFDLLLVLDVLEHQENVFSFLRDIKPLAPYKLFHTVLDLSAQSVARQDGLTRRRRDLHDLHFFTKDLFLQNLTDENYEIVDWFYSPRRLNVASNLVDVVKQLPRTIAYAIHKDTAVRLLGGYGLFVLAK